MKKFEKLELSTQNIHSEPLPCILFDLYINQGIEVILRKKNLHVSYTWYKSLLQTEITLGPGQSLSGCCNSVRKSEEEKRPSVGLSQETLIFWPKSWHFFRIKSAISSPSAYFIFAEDFFQEHYISHRYICIYFHFYRKVLEVHWFLIGMEAKV